MSGEARYFASAKDLNTLTKHPTHRRPQPRHGRASGHPRLSARGIITSDRFNFTGPPPAIPPAHFHLSKIFAAPLRPAVGSRWRASRRKVTMVTPIFTENYHPESSHVFSVSEHNSLNQIWDFVCFRLIFESQVNYLGSIGPRSFRLPPSWPRKRPSTPYCRCI